MKRLKEEKRRKEEEKRKEEEEKKRSEDIKKILLLLSKDPSSVSLSDIEKVVPYLDDLILKKEPEVSTHVLFHFFKKIFNKF